MLQRGTTHCFVIDTLCIICLIFYFYCYRFLSGAFNAIMLCKIVFGGEEVQKDVEQSSQQKTKKAELQHQG